MVVVGGAVVVVVGDCEGVVVAGALVEGRVMVDVTAGSVVSLLAVVHAASTNKTTPSRRIAGQLMPTLGL